MEYTLQRELTQYNNIMEVHTAELIQNNKYYGVHTAELTGHSMYHGGAHCITDTK